MRSWQRRRLRPSSRSQIWATRLFSLCPTIVLDYPRLTRRPVIASTLWTACLVQQLPQSGEFKEEPEDAVQRPIDLAHARTAPFPAAVDRRGNRRLFHRPAKPTASMNLSRALPLLLSSFALFPFRHQNLRGVSDGVEAVGSRPSARRRCNPPEPVANRWPPRSRGARWSQKLFHDRTQ